MSKKDVETGEKQWLDAFNGGDASGVAQMYTMDGRIMPPNAETVTGRSEIEGFVKEFVQTGAKLSFNSVHVHETPELCASVGRYEMEIPTPGGPQRDSGKFIELWAKQSDGSWRIIEDIFNSSLPVPEA